MTAHVEDSTQGNGLRVSEQPSEMQKDILLEAQAATDKEHDLTFLKSVRLYPKAIAWSMLLSTAIIMEGYDTKLVGSLFAQPAFRKRYGSQLPNGSYQISASWQAGLSNGASIGSLIGLFMNGYISERVGFRKTMLGALAFLAVMVFIPFFAPSIEVLQVGQILMGIPWGIFQTLTTSYAAEVTPTHLRAYVTTYVNLCWVFGQLISAGVLRGTLVRTDQWSYRIPFALQWIWPVPLIVGIVFAPESPWWLVRRNRIDEAKAALLRLTSPNRIEFDVDKAIMLMVVTTENEQEAGTGTHYLDCFRGVDLRRTIISCSCWGIQILSGTGLRTYSTYFYQQAGLPTDRAFTMSIVQYAMGIVGVFVAWFLLPHFGRRTIYMWGLACLTSCLVVIGGLGSASSKSSPAFAWAIGSMLIVYTLVYDITVGPICYSLVSEVPSVRLRSKTIVLARMSYNILNIASNVITPYMLNPGAWNWGAKAGFFFGGTGLLSLVLTYFCVPEPKGRTYAELTILFQKRVSARKFSTTFVELSDANGLNRPPSTEKGD
ncbi:general substrate transporter [Lipomyces starkeyi]